MLVTATLVNTGSPSRALFGMRLVIASVRVPAANATSATSSSRQSSSQPPKTGQVGTPAALRSTSGTAPMPISSAKRPVTNT